MRQERIDQLARLLAAGEASRQAGTESLDRAEAALPPDATPSRPQDILDAVEANLSPPRGIDEAEWRKARDQLLKHAGSALARLKQGDRQLAADEGCAMEAIVVSDGTRPSFLLCDGEVASDDPFLGSWGGQVKTAEANGIARLIAAVGRIQPANGHASRFIGTGTLIDRDAGLVLTNYHVIESARSDFGVAMTQTDNRIRVDGVLEIDFVGESCSLATCRFRIAEVLLPAGYGSTFDGLDAAVARIEPLKAGASLPETVPQLSRDPAYATGALTSLALIGFPAAPAFQDGENVDWDFVIKTLFGNRFGVKRLAPGRFTQPLGSHPQDTRALAIGHDATTFGGASGALVAAWLDPETPCFAIHFGGKTESGNYALSFAAVHKALEAIGIGFGHA